MKLRLFLLFMLVFFAVALWLGRVSISARWPERVDVSFALSLTFMAAGGLLAAVSLFSLLQRGLTGQTLEQNLPLVIVLLGGLLLYQVNWGVALAVGIIVAAGVVARSLSGPKGPDKE